MAITTWFVPLLKQAIQLLLKHLLALKIGYYFGYQSYLRKFWSFIQSFTGRIGDKFTVIEDSYLLSCCLVKECEREYVEDKFGLFEELKKMVDV